MFTLDSCKRRAARLAKAEAERATQALPPEVPEAGAGEKFLGKVYVVGTCILLVGGVVYLLTLVDWSSPSGENSASTYRNIAMLQRHQIHQDLREIDRDLDQINDTIDF